ncbi:MAG: nucleoside triphosphate pyrophosphohydrolase [Sphaerochaetaceae bacterium]
MINYTYEKKDTLQDAFMQLFDIVRMLRSPEGCPWDQKQTNKDIAINTLDETYEYLDALQQKDMIGISEELGDVLLNVMMLLEMHNEKPDFDIVQSVNDVCAKLIRRHPHVFSDAKASNSEEVLVLWNKIKKDVEGKTSAENNFFSRVPKSLPPLEMCKEINKQVAKVGFDWPDKQGVIDKVCEELDEVIEADTALDRVQDEVEMEIGDLLFAVVNYARHLKVDPANALRQSNEKFERRFNGVCELAKQQGIPLEKEQFQKMDALWNQVKEKEVNA